MGQCGRAGKKVSAGRRGGRGPAAHPLIAAAAAAWIEGLEQRTLFSTTALTPSADAFVATDPSNAVVATANFGADPSLDAGTSGGETDETYVTFNISGVSSVGKAVLQLTGQSLGGSPVTVGVYGVADPAWVEGNGTVPGGSGTYDTDNNPAGEITYANRPAEGATPLASADVDIVSAVTSWDVTSYVQAAKLAGATAVSFAVKPSAGSPLVVFNSKEASGGAGPTLSVDSDTTAPQAVITAPDVTTPTQSEVVTVKYTDDAGLNVSSIDANDITVSGPQGPVSVASFTVNGSNPYDVTATYTLNTPGGMWSASQNGPYTVSVVNGQVVDLANNSATATPKVFNVAISSPDTTPPTAAVAAPDITTGGAATSTFTVTYSDNVAIKASTIGVGDVSVAKAGGSPLTITKVSTAPASGDASQIIATYTVAAPGGSWSSSDNGAYTITVPAGAVTDTSNNGVSAATGSFNVNIAAADTTPPAAVITTTDVTAAGAATATFTITYTDNVAVKASTIAVGSVTVARSGGPTLTVTKVSLSTSANAATVVATYTVAAPGGSWNATDNGTYTISLLPGQVKDTSGNAVAAQAGTLTVNIGGVDTVPPTAVISPVAAITAGGAATLQVTVTYSDNVAVAVSSIDPADLTVTGPAGTFVVSSVTVSPSTGNGTPRTAVYTLIVPGGAWSSADNGTYTVSVKANQVFDTANNAAAAVSGQFTVNLPAGPAVGPTATVSPMQPIVSSGGATTSVVVTYQDAAGVKASSITPASLSVSGPAGALTVSSVSLSPAADASSITATYTVAAPGGGWSPAANGTYDITTVAGTVTDVNGVAATVGTGTFRVSIAQALPVIDAGFNGGSPVSSGFVTEAFAQDGDGKVLVAGHQGDASTNTLQSVLQRLNADGSLDTFFGQSGQVISDVGTNDAFFALATDSSGRIIAAGRRGADVLVSRYLSNGKLDKKFGTRGTVVTDLGGADDTAYAIAVAPDGSVVIGGVSGGQYAFARYTSRGRLDTPFGTGGVSLISPGTGATGTIGSIALAADGTIIAVGATSGDSAVRTRGCRRAASHGDRPDRHDIRHRREDHGARPGGSHRSWRDGSD